MLTPGTIIGGDFRVVRPLREGGMGAVYVVEQLSIGETRALKVMLEGAHGPEDSERSRKVRQRFLEEARKSSGLRSAHVVKVIASGVDEGLALPWLVMELLHGEDLEGVLRRRGRLPWSELVALLEQVGHGIAAAHAAGVLHLDLKPENIFICAAESPGLPFAAKILDFGIGRVLEERRSSATATTAIGSPLWMAPEQALQGQVSAATDIWPLGLIAYRCLTGFHYWREPNRSETDFAPARWFLELMTQDLDAASARAREQGVDSLLPVGFDAWFARCVTRDPAARWQRVDEAVDHLRRLQGPSSAAVSLPPTMQFPNAPTAPPLTASPPIAAGTVPPTMALAGMSMPTPPPSAKPQAPPTRRGLLLVIAAVSAVLLTLAGQAVRARPSHSTTTAPHAQVAGPIDAALSASTDAAVVSPPPRYSCPEGFVLVQGGDVSAPAPEPSDASAPVRAGAFCMQAYEVTVDEYLACVASGAVPACTVPMRHRDCNTTYRDRGSHPMNCADWRNAVAWCAWRFPQGRLPSNAEWTLAARGRGRRFPWGDDAVAAPVCWTEPLPVGRQVQHTCPIQRAEGDTTPDGVHGLAGNIAEWTADPCHFVGGVEHVARGRAFCERASDPEIRCGGDSEPLAGGQIFIGFRCVVTPTSAP